MVAIRRQKTRNPDYGPDPAIDLPGGAHLKVKGQKLFTPRFHEDTGDLWSPTLSLILEVVDDFTEEGSYDGLTFADRFELKVDEDMLDTLGLEEKSLRDANASDFTAEERKKISDMDNWTIRENTKLDSFLSCIHGKKWVDGKMEFDPKDIVGAELIARIQPRTGKRPGSFTDWNSYVSLQRPKKKKKTQTGKSGKNSSKGSDTIDLAKEDMEALEQAPF
jgi:hypothetical protein